MKITTCASVNAPEALLLTKDRTDSSSDGIDGGTGSNFIFLSEIGPQPKPFYENH